MVFASRKSILACGVALCAMVGGSLAWAQERSFNLPSEEAVLAIPEFARQAGIQIIAPAENIKGLKLPAIKGVRDVREALAELIANTDLVIASDSGQLIVLKVADKKPPKQQSFVERPAPVKSAGAFEDGEAIETVTVMGFRASLEKALDIKRNSLGATDSIFAEDIGKFPDMNVAESLQRIPGVALQRGSGEGEQITVRGLGPQFTRVRINGMEAMATTMDTANGTNRGRGFDFNVFASELFTQLTVRKTASAETEEGSLGATVDLRTAHPFDSSGFVLMTSAQLGYQDFAGSINPRLAAMVSDVFLGGRLGVLISAAYEKKRVLTEGSNTNGWNYGSSSSNYFGTVNGASSGAEYTAVNAAYAPRLPRYETIRNHIERSGLTASVQWQPGDKTLFTLDALYADFANERQTYDLEAYAFSVSGTGSSKGTGLPATLGHRAINIIDYTLDESRNSLLAVSATNVGLRTESRLDHLDTRFMQATLEGTHDFSESLKLRVMLGWSESHHRNPIQTTLTADYNCTDATSVTGDVSGCPGGQSGGAGSDSNPYVYDYTSDNYLPYISYGNVDATDTNGWFLSQIREREQYVFNSFRTAQADASYTVMDGLKLEGGVNFKNYGFRTFDLRRSVGTTSNQDYVIPEAIRNASLSDYAMIANLHDIGAPQGTTTSWWVPNINKFNALYNIWDETVYNGAFAMGVEPGLSNSGRIVENDYGAWFQVNWQSSIYDIPFSGNVGLRYVLTEQWAQGYSYDSDAQALVINEKGQTYHDFLPSLNLVLEPADNFLVRLNGSYAMARPDLSSSFPKATVAVSGNSLSVSLGNPLLKPFRSKNIDLSYEWYYHKGALLSVAFFYKHIDSFVQTLVSNIVYSDNPYGLSNDLVASACGSSYGSSCNEDLVWSFSRPINTKGGPLYGTEINWQQPLDFLPGRFGNLGVMANVTFVQATQSYLDSSGALLAKADLTNLSRSTVNATIYYDDQVFQARMTFSSRSKYLNSVPGGYDQDYGVTKGEIGVDAAVSYKIDNHLMATFDAINLTDEASISYVDSVGIRANSWSKSGRSFFVGLRYNY